MQSATGRKTRYGVIVLAVAALLPLVAVAILAKEGPSAGNPQALLRSIAAAFEMYDTSGNRDQCLSNVKQITRAIQMYLNDYGKLPPEERGQKALDYFAQLEPKIVNCQKVTGANPYLRWPVVLDDYIKSRSTWDCPSARLSKGSLWIIPAPDWLGYLRKNQDKWGKKTGVGPCAGAWPAGWGGSVTDSIAQGEAEGPADPPKGAGAFRQTIGYSAAYGLSAAQVADPAWFVVCGDSQHETIWSPVALAYPDVCKVTMSADTVGCGADWENCPFTQSCGLSAQAQKLFWKDAELRRRFTRHLGGSNIGFLDGHAAWMSADDIIANSPTSKDQNRGKLRGVKCLCLGMPGDESDSGEGD